MHPIIFVAAGGAVGAALRYGIASWMEIYSDTALPQGTLVVNLLGSLAIGWLWGVFAAQTEVPLRLQLFLITGLLGGFTTFSSFSLENWQLIEAGNWRTFIIYVLVSNLGGIALAFAGFRLSGNAIHG